MNANLFEYFPLEVLVIGLMFFWLTYKILSITEQTRDGKLTDSPEDVSSSR